MRVTRIFLLPALLAVTACGGEPPLPLRAGAPAEEHEAAARDCRTSTGLAAGLPVEAEFADCMRLKGF